MPCYEYVCKNDHRTTQSRSIKTLIVDLETSTCEKCGEYAELVPSRPGRPILVGRGFHQNDYPHGNLGS